MSPRAYRMTSRADATARTREAVIRAARELHSRRGFMATGWDDIAAEAGVSTATVYRHFPSLAELVPACAHTVFDIIQPPTLDQAASTFAELATAGDRFEQLVRDSCHCYHAGSDWLHAAYRERDFIPELDDALDVIEGSLRVLVTAAAGRRLKASDHGLLFVLCNFPLWRSLIETGSTARATEDHLVRIVRTEADRLGLDTAPPRRRSAPPAPEPSASDTSRRRP